MHIALCDQWELLCGGMCCFSDGGSIWYGVPLGSSPEVTALQWLIKSSMNTTEHSHVLLCQALPQQLPKGNDDTPAPSDGMRNHKVYV